MTIRCLAVALTLTCGVGTWACDERERSASDRAGSRPLSSDPQLVALKQTCAEAGKRASQEFREQWHGETFPDDPEYVYNATMKTCLYADTYSDVGGNPLHPETAREISFVMDVFSNQMLAEYTAYNGEALKTSMTKAEFDHKRRELMAQ